MEPASPARLYATLVGALLVVLGILGFFYSASFGSPGTVEAALGALRVNAWLNVAYVATGSIGLLLAGCASRPYALVLGFLFTALAIWGFALGGGEAILGFLPVNDGNDILHLVLGLLGLAAAAGTPKEKDSQSRGSLGTRDAPKEPRDGSKPLKARTKLARKGA
jgi:hypothetical protein